MKNEEIIDLIKSSYLAFAGEEYDELEILPISGSDRRYFRIFHDGGSMIATYNHNIRENETFIYFSKHFGNRELNVPEIYYLSDNGLVYFQEDVGNTSLLNHLESEGYVEDVKDLYKKSLSELARLQIKGDEGMDYERCLTSQYFGKQAIEADMLYFQYYFLAPSKIAFDKHLLLKDFDKLSQNLADTELTYFMFRDFQSRNIQIKEGEPYFIDYQGGMKGAIAYDAASLLWQARAKLPIEWKDELIDHYIQAVENELGKPIDAEEFKANYHGFILLRLLQVLGAYGYRGLFERKAHFLISIPVALENLKWFINNRTLPLELPVLQEVLEKITQEEFIDQFRIERATADTPLKVYIHSFSYKKGYPEDPSGNGGGFNFDCRGILNPGRIEEYKTQTGRDTDVKKYLEEKTEMPEFLAHIWNTIDIPIQQYMKRGFDSLQINFGCTGGQHRSVYAADETARYIKNKYGLPVEVKHIEQEKKNWINQPY